MWRRSHTAVGIALALAAGASTARAQVVVLGNAQGCFNLGCVGAEGTSALSPSGVPVSYSSGQPVDFSGTTTNGFLAIDGAVGNFGTITLGTSWTPKAVVMPFFLTISFLNPVAASTVFDALLLGYVAFDNFGGAVIGFYPPTSPNLTFTDPTSGLSGTMNVTAFPAAMAAGGSTKLTGLIQVSSVMTVTPEPAAMILIGTGLLGLAGAARRRKRTD